MWWGKKVENCANERTWRLQKVAEEVEVLREELFKLRDVLQQNDTDFARLEQENHQLKCQLAGSEPSNRSLH